MKTETTRRDFLRSAGRILGVGVLGVLGLALGRGARRAGGSEYVWQIDPEKCTQCGRCATACVVSPSAVKCVHAYDVCGYCKLCGGFHQPNTKTTDTAAENQLCPTSAIRRRFIEDPYFQYDIVEELCVGCGKCVKGCGSFGNGSLFLQVRHDRCVNCNECSIARQCPGEAFVRVPSTRPYRLRGEQGRV
jgi:electron transport complex protein RnfB